MQGFEQALQLEDHTYGFAGRWVRCVLTAPIGLQFVRHASGWDDHIAVTIDHDARLAFLHRVSHQEIEECLKLDYDQV